MALIAGPSGGGKSKLTTGVLERLATAGYQFCAFDPEGDYEAVPEAVHLGTQDRAPAVEEVMDVLQRPDQSVVVCLLALPRADRAAYFARLLALLDAL